MNRVYCKKFLLIMVLLCFTALLPMLAKSDVIVYPAKGQSNEQLSKDRYECHMWAVQQSGFDPSNAQANQSSPQPQQKDQVLRGGARGAAAGAAIGAIAGNAGKGAAIGATAGGLKEVFRNWTATGTLRINQLLRRQVTGCLQSSPWRLPERTWLFGKLSTATSRTGFVNPSAKFLLHKYIEKILIQGYVEILRP